ncbi:IMV membrane protein A9, partial [Monkeypox virus]
MSCYTA